jgi:hypothetical protein
VLTVSASTAVTHACVSYLFTYLQKSFTNRGVANRGIANRVLVLRTGISVCIQFLQRHSGVLICILASTYQLLLFTGL